MMFLKQLRTLARYNVLTPVAVLATAIAAQPVYAATIVVNSPDTDGVQLTATDNALENNSAISNSSGLYAVSGTGSDPVLFITNAAGATITGLNANAVGIGNGGIGTFTNNGTISTNQDQAVGTDGVITTFINTGTITDTDASFSAAVGALGGFGSFTNSGLISGTDMGVGTNGNVVSFLNSGTISGAGDSGVLINGVVTDFSNTGIITGKGYQAVRFGLAVTNFTNGAGGWIENLDGLGVAGLSVGVGFNGDVANFTNNGTIKGDPNSNSVDGSVGVGFFNGSGVTTFVNGGTIFGKKQAVDIGGAVTSFTNTGTIQSVDQSSIWIGGTTGTFTNSGTITSTNAGAVGFGGQVGTFTNSGTINGAKWDAIFFNKGVTSFVNQAGGTIQNTDSLGSSGDGVSFNTDLINGGAVGTFANYGQILGATNTTSGAGVGFWENGNGAHALTSFLNAGTISGNNYGVFIAGDVGTLTNSGTILSGNGRGIELRGLITNFNNSGNITSLKNGVSFLAGVINGTNSGTIMSTAASGEIGVRIDGTGGTFDNSGTIQGAAGIAYFLPGAGSGTVTNSGTIRGTLGTAIAFDWGAASGDDRLTILTGSKIFGDINFGAGGNDVFNFADFRGNTLLNVYGLDAVEPGTTNYVWDQPNQQIAIFDLTSTSSVGSSVADLAGTINGIIGSQFGGFELNSLNARDVLNYAPVRPQAAAETAAESAVLSELDVGGNGGKAWATVFGGGSSDSAPISLSNVFGGIVAGTHARLVDSTDLGLLGGYARSQYNVLAGQQVLTTDTGLIGLYGRTEMGVVDVSFSLLGGYNGHKSAREVIAFGMTEVAQASFNSWFLSPTIGVEMPVLANENGEVSVVASATYVGGGVSGYTETGSSMNLVVGSQTIGVFDGRIGLLARAAISSNEFGGVSLLGKGGFFAQANFGSSTVPVTVLGQTINAVTPGSSGYGVYAGVGIEAAVSNNVGITGGLDASVRSDGLVAGAAKAGIEGTF